MRESCDSQDGPPVRYALIVLAVSWLVWLLGLARAAEIRSRFAGPTDDVADSLRLDAYVAERLLGFSIVAVIGCVAAAVVLLGKHKPTMWNVLAWGLVMVSAAWHGFALLMHLLFAS